MKCRDIEKQIYLYNELTEREQKETDEHLKGCESCLRTMKEAILLKSVVTVHQSHSPVMPNQSLMTHRVMNAIAAKQSKGPRFWEEVVSSLKVSALRYVMATLSILLVSIFVIESADQGEILQRQETSGAVLGSKTALDLASFHSAFYKKKKTQDRSRTEFATCIAECLHNANSGCEACTNKFMKP